MMSIIEYLHISMAQRDWNRYDKYRFRRNQTRVFRNIFQEIFVGEIYFSLHFQFSSHLFSFSQFFFMVKRVRVRVGGERGATSNLALNLCLLFLSPFPIFVYEKS